MEPAARRDSLWWMVVSPSLWALHVLLSYGTVAVWCAKIASRDGALDGARVAVLVYTAFALTGVVAVGARGLGRERAVATPRYADTPGARRRFLGYTNLLLSALSFVAIVFGALPVLYLRSCR
ncbi:MAG: hypothetical protein HYV09_08845 [Deltaproteobacteria bacterium]|nr:hypothetical protein [Deltaproteobacteria bacterium]